MTPAELTELRETIARLRGWMPQKNGWWQDPRGYHHKRVPDFDEIPAVILETLEAMMRDGHEPMHGIYSKGGMFFINGINAKSQPTLALAVCAAYPVWMEQKRNATAPTKEPDNG